MFIKHWTPYDYDVSVAYEEYYDRAIEELESLGLEGKMMLAAILGRKGKFDELYSQYKHNEAIRYLE